jgi:hypothetical protein
MPRKIRSMKKKRVRTNKRSVKRGGAGLRRSRTNKRSVKRGGNNGMFSKFGRALSYPLKAIGKIVPRKSRRGPTERLKMGKHMKGRPGIAPPPPGNHESNTEYETSEEELKNTPGRVAYKNEPANAPSAPVIRRQDGSNNNGYYVKLNKIRARKRQTSTSIPKTSTSIPKMRHSTVTTRNSTGIVSNANVGPERLYAELSFSSNKSGRSIPESESESEVEYAHLLIFEELDAIKDISDENQLYFFTIEEIKNIIKKYDGTGDKICFFVKDNGKAQLIAYNAITSNDKKIQLGVTVDNFKNNFFGNYKQNPKKLMDNIGFSENDERPTIDTIFSDYKYVYLLNPSEA